VNELQLVLVDSSAWIEALRPKGDKLIVSRVRTLLEEGRAAWCDIVALELWHGARGKKERQVLSELQRTLTCFQIDKPVWKNALNIATKARDAGLTVPTADLLIEACAQQNHIALEHCDKHLSLLEEIRGK